MPLTDLEKKDYVDNHITEIYPQLLINMQKICGAGHSHWGDDLLSVAMEYFLLKPIDVKYESCINNKAENFITYIANFQLKSSFSKFWHTHRRFSTSMREYYSDGYVYNSETDHTFEDDDRMLCIKRAVKDLDPFEKMLVEERILKGMKFKELSERYDIPYNSLTHTLKKTIKKIKNKCKNFSQFL